MTDPDEQGCRKKSRTENCIAVSYILTYLTIILPMFIIVKIVLDRLDLKISGTVALGSESNS